MKNIQKIAVLSMTVTGFRNFAEPVTWDFGRMTLVSGHNATGKSGIADALAFALTGAPFFGGRGLDELHHDGNAPMTVELRFADQAMQPHTLLRTRVNGGVSQSLDGVEITQKRLAELLGGKDLVLSLLNPLYFAEALGTDGRKLLEQLIPVPAHEAVMERLSEHMRGILGGDRLLQPEAYLRSRRAELRELERDIQYAEGQKDATNRQRKSLSDSLGQKTAELAHVCASIQIYEKKRTTGIDRAALDAKIREVNARLAAGQASSVQTEIERLRARIAQLEGARYQSKQTEQLARIKAALDQKYQEHARVRGIAARLTAGAYCPTCRRLIDPQSAPAVQKAYESALQQIVSQGAPLRAQYDKLTAAEQSAREQWNAAREKQLAAVRDKLAQLEKEPVSDNTEELQKTLKALSYRMEFGMLTAGEARHYQQLSGQKTKLETEIATLNDALDKLPNDQTAALGEMEQRRTQIRDKLTAAQTYLSARYELMFSELPGLKRTKLVLFETAKETGEVRDAFQITYDGRPYLRLSLSEKLKCGLEIVGMLSQLSGRAYPIFVDNTESVCDLGVDIRSSQLIMARVQKGAPLTVRAMDAPLRKAG